MICFALREPAHPPTPSLSNSRILFRSDRLGKMKLGASQSLRKKSGYLPSLDGWRALAILGVLMTHDYPSRSGWFGNLQGFGGYGVYLFFAISGILICTRILEEEAAVGRFRLGSFYIRRLFRIQPAAVTYLAVIGLLTIAGCIHERWHFWDGALFLYANYLYHASDQTGGSAFTGHFWTLSVEEHFYIVLSLVLFGFRRHRIKIFAGLIVLIWFLQHTARAHGLYVNGISSRRTPWVILYLLIPSFFALLLRLPGIRVLVDRFLEPWVAYLLTASLILLDRIRVHPVEFWSLRGVLEDQQPYLFLGFSLWVIATMLHRHSWSTRLLELPPMRFAGRLSYSIYLWHVLFFLSANPVSHVSWPPLVFLAQRPWRYIASLACAMASYYLIEKPLIRVGHRLGPPVSPGHRDLEAEPTEASPIPVLPAPAM